jgi:hypothetical protein
MVPYAWLNPARVRRFPLNDAHGELSRVVVKLSLSLSALGAAETRQERVEQGSEALGGVGGDEAKRWREGVGRGAVRAGRGRCCGRKCSC